MSVGNNCDLSSGLTPEEIDAGKHYGADARFLHAVAQSRSEDLVGDERFVEFQTRASALARNLTSAISKSRTKSALQTYAGHGRGLTLIGSLSGKPTQFVGLKYCYPGFISTSIVREKATGSFLEKTASRGSSPVLLQFHLPAGFNALDMADVGMSGEFEILIGRSETFEIKGATFEEIPRVDDPVLVLDLIPDA